MSAGELILRLWPDKAKKQFTIRAGRMKALLDFMYATEGLAEDDPNWSTEAQRLRRRWMAYED